MTRDVLQVPMNGLIAGSTVALLAVSYSLIYSILRFINFTFGEVLMVGAYVFYFFKVEFGVPTTLAGLGAVVILGFAGALVQIGAYKPFYRRSRLACLITALGVSLILQNIALIWFEGRPLSLRAQITTRVFHLAGISITDLQVAIFVAAIALLIVTDLLVFRSDFGLRLRALADNLSMAEILGMDVARAVGGVFLLGSCFAATAGVFVSFENVLKPTMGVSLGIEAFAACVLGGIGSIRGAVAAAFFVSVVSHLVSFRVPLITPETTAYAILLLTLACFMHERCRGGLLGTTWRRWC